MRTYKPKKPIYQKIENVEELCRLCLEKTQGGVPIFKDEQNVCAAVAMRIMICVGLDIKRDESLANMICKTCYEELERYYKFRRKCELSYRKLKYHILATKLGEQTDLSTNHSLQCNEVVAPLCEMTEEKSEGAQIPKELETDDGKQLIIEFSRTSSDVVEKITEETVEMEEVQIPLQAEINPDIGTFLSGILTELGILSRQDGGLKLQQDISSFELETGDGEQMILELMEESDEHSFNIFEDKLPQKCELKEEPIVVIEDKLNTDTNKLRGGKTSRPWCSICGRAFSSRSASVRHARVHSGARPYACHCGATFAQKSVLQRHMLVHLEVRPHQCPECNKSFTQRASLSQHMRAHAPPPARPLALHRCTICDKVFLHTSGLSRHMFTHAGRLYECSVCNKQFRDKSSLARHLKNYHKGHSTNKPRKNVVGNYVATQNTTGFTVGDNIAIENVIGNNIARENVIGNTIVRENVSGNNISNTYSDSRTDERGTVLMKDEVG